jgi:hypothetical protein
VRGGRPRIGRRLGRGAGQPATVADFGAGAARRRLVIWRTRLQDRELLQTWGSGPVTSHERSPPDGQCHPER